MATKVVGFRIKLEGDEELSNDLVRLTGELNKLTEEKKKLDKELKDPAVKDNAEATAKLNKQIAETAINIKSTRKELGQQQTAFLKNRAAIEATTGSYNDLVKRNQSLRAELKALPNAFDKTNTKVSALQKEIKGVTDDLKKFDKELGDNFREVGNYGNAIEGLAGKLQGLNLNQTGANVSLSGSGGILQSIIPQIAKVGGVYGIAAAAVVAGTVAVTDALLDLTKEINKANSEVTKLFGTTGTDLQKLSAGIQATADTFGKDFNEVLLTTNTLAKEFGITGEAALKLINEGFIAGADINGEFLDILKEYPTQFKASGFEAEQFIGVITQSVKEGIFSDKGVDAVKEFGLRIREQTSATTTALENAFGKNFTNKLLKGVRDGSISTAKALSQVSGALKTGGIEADRLQTVLADVFGGPGEDAGLRFLQTLTNVDQEITLLIDDTDKYVIAQKALLDANQRIELAQQQIVAAFDLTGNELSGLGDQLTAFILEGLVKLIDVGVDVINFFIGFFNESQAARGALAAFGAGAKTVLAAVQLNFELIADGFKTVFKGFKALSNLDFAGIKDAVLEGFIEAKDDVVNFGEKTATNFTQAFEDTFKERKPIEKINKETLFKPAEKAGAAAGKAAGDAFVKGIQTTTSDQKKADATAKKANIAAQKAFKKFFEPTKDLKIQVDPDEIFQFVETGDERNEFQKLFGLNQEEQDVFLEQAKDFALVISEGVNEIIFANKQKRLTEETDAELSALDEQTDNQISALEDQLDQDLLNTNLTDEQKIKLKKDFEKASLAIEEKAAVDRAKIELEAAKKTRALEAKQAVVSAFLGAGRALANPPGPPFTIPNSLLALGLGLAQAAKIRATPLALGGDFTTSGPELLLVGDNPGGQERVQVTPLSSPNVNGPQVNQNFVNNNQGGIDADAIAAIVIQSIEMIPVVVSEGDITTVQKRARVIESESGF